MEPFPRRNSYIKSLFHHECIVIKGATPQLHEFMVFEYVADATPSVDDVEKLFLGNVYIINGFNRAVDT
ncbi:hypothetical protein DAPPUDRAFT_325704 [Daphnia pulex]|uniref:Uncharacterized protein n=1 Tax=Daphnia pulex TaxID=6669 RepID=E9H5T7_DAPPU|nr:hypothetical protein DAPPUDRAFT_325704 [Daphnia pulex]|eukprot:EFX73027.1 hypothetical protein DAPPUDRAFT_325704 [Daphnia pulex]